MQSDRTINNIIYANITSTIKIKGRGFPGWVIKIRDARTSLSLPQLNQGGYISVGWRAQGYFTIFNKIIQKLKYSSRVRPCIAIGAPDRYFFLRHFVLRDRRCVTRRL